MDNPYALQFNVGEIVIVTLTECGCFQCERDVGKVGRVRGVGNSVYKTIIYRVELENGEEEQFNEQEGDGLIVGDSEDSRNASPPNPVMRVGSSYRQKGQVLFSDSPALGCS